MPLTKLQFQPGINRETTQYTNEGGWYDMDKVRFRYSLPEKIGGWTKVTSSYFLGTCRAIHQWSNLSGDTLTGVGCNSKYYLFEGGTLHDITPISSTTTAGEATFSAMVGTLANPMDAEQNTIDLVSAASFLSIGGRVRIDSEEMTYGGVSGNTLTGVARGANGTSPATHSAAATVESPDLIVTDNSSGVLLGNFVTFSAATSLGGNITADILNQEYTVTGVISSNQYVIEARTVSAIQSITGPSGLTPTYVYANSSDIGNGGASVVAVYQIDVGLDTSIFGSGWGAGVWSRGTWGSAASTAVPGAKLRLWSHDNFGEDLLYNVRDGNIYYWDATLGPSSRGVALSSLPGSQAAPTIARQVLVSDRDRHIIAFGCDDEFSIGTQDPLLIRFSDQESLTEWRTLPTTTAGSLRLGSGSGIICAVETKQQTLVFTDVSLHAMQYLGPPFTFGIDIVSENITIAGPSAAVSVDDTVFWMGLNEFYSYNGVVQNMPCSVKDYVFNDLNLSQIEKVSAGVNTSFAEVWWFYPSAESNENDRYVIYNYQQDIWYYGTMARTAWEDRGTDDYPIAAGTDGSLYFHENGLDDGSVDPAVGISAYIQSSGTSIGNGDQFALIGKVIPDINFRNSAPMPSVTMTIKASNFPGGTFLQDDDGVVMRTSSVPVQQFTNQLYFRLRGRSFFFRIESDAVGVAWRLGTPRVEVRTDGRR